MENIGKGKLIVQVYTADKALPIADATVLVTRDGENGEELVKVMQTDRSGKTPPLLLAAPPAENSLDPDGINRFYGYNIRVDSSGYYTMENLNVPIFENLTAIQPFALIPLPADDKSGKKVSVIEELNQNE